MPSRDELLAQYEELEARIESAAVGEVWELADWLVENVEPRAGQGRTSGSRVPEVTLADLAELGGRSPRWLRAMRQVAEVTRQERLPGVSVRAYQQALSSADWDIARANEAIRRRGTRLRDHATRMESPGSIGRQIRQLPPNVRSELVSGLLTDGETAHGVVSDPDTRGALLAAMNEVDRRTESPRPPRPDRFAHERLERKAERAYFDLLDLIRSGQDIALPDPTHILGVFDRIEEALGVARGLFQAGSTDEAIERWLENAELR